MSTTSRYAFPLMLNTALREPMKSTDGLRARRVLHEPPVPDLRGAPEPLHHMEGVLDASADP